MSDSIPPAGIEKLQTEQNRLKQGLLSRTISIRDFLRQVQDLDRYGAFQDETTRILSLLTDPEVVQLFEQEVRQQFQYNYLLSLSYVHLGQLQMGTSPESAIPTFEAALKAAEKNSDGGEDDWTCYIRAYIAYCKSDIAGLEAERQKMHPGEYKEQAAYLLKYLREIGSHQAETKRVEQRKEYKELLSAYSAVWGDIKKFESRHRGNKGDQEYRASLQAMDKERHEIHLKMLAIGTKIDKGVSDVMADILNAEGNLAEYGLPDVTLFQGYAYSKDEFEPHESYILFTVGDSTIGDRYDPRPEIPRLNSAVQLKRLHVLANRLNLDTKKFDDEFSHSRSHSVLCLAVPNDKLESAASAIREHPDRYHPNEAHFDSEEKEEAKKQFERDIQRFLAHVGREDYAEETLAYFKKNGNAEEIEIVEAVVREMPKNPFRR